jgi:thiamine biosynthesis protein ThiI
LPHYRILEQFNLILIRYSEIWLKSQKVKIRMLKILMDNLKKLLTQEGISFHKYQLSKDSSRIFFFFDNSFIEKAINICLKVFGIHSVSPALRTSNNLNNIIERTLEVAQVVLEKGDSFALKVKRSGKHNFSSLEVAQTVGKAILDRLPTLNLKVNLSHPKKMIFIEIRDEFSYIFLDVIESKWGGLPIENSKKVLVMDVGRVNDLLAGFLLMRRGCELYPLLFDNTNNQESFETWLKNWREITQFVPLDYISINKINLFGILSKLSIKLEEKKYFCALCRMIRMAIIAHYLKTSEETFISKIRAITDGTTLNNATFCNDVVDLESLTLNHLFSVYPIFTSLIGLNDDTINDFLSLISSNLKGFDYCAFKPNNQEININVVKKLYDSLKIEELIEQSLTNLEKINLSFKLD